jgi:hypothetical protein
MLALYHVQSMDHANIKLAKQTAHIIGAIEATVPRL